MIIYHTCIGCSYYTESGFCTVVVEGHENFPDGVTLWWIRCVHDTLDTFWRKYGPNFSFDDPLKVKTVVVYTKFQFLIWGWSDKKNRDKKLDKDDFLLLKIKIWETYRRVKP